MAPLRGVLLDIDGTLLTTGDAIGAAAAAAFLHLWPELGEERAAQAADRFRRDPDGWFGRYTRGELAFAPMRAGRLAEVTAWLGVETDDTTHDRYAEVYDPALAAGVTVFDDVEPALRAWRDAGLAVGALTNASQRITDAKLVTAGLTDAFDVLVTTDTAGYGKPDPRVFLAACSALGTEPEATAYVGDELEADALGSRDAGLVSCWLVRGEAPAEPPERVRVLTSLTDLGAGPAPR